MRFTVVVCAAMLWSGVATAAANEDLLEAASQGETSKVQKALSRGASVDARGEKNATPLMLAAEKGHLDIVRALLAAGADAKATRTGGLAAIHGAAATGKLDVVKELLAAGAEVNGATEKGLTPLHAAAMSENRDLLDALLSAGAQKAATDARGFNGVDYALGSRRWAGMQHLLSLGVELSERGRKTALHSVIATPADFLSKLPVADGATVKALIAAGADREALNGDGLTPLLAAAKVGHVEAVEALLEAKVNVAAVDAEANGVLALAASRDVVENARMLLALSNASSANGMRALFQPAERSDVSPSTARRLAVARALIAAGAAVNGANKNLHTPLHKAVQVGDAELVELLAASGAPLNARANGGSTALVMAVQYQMDAVAQVLLEAGADPAIANDNGQTALDFARRHEDSKTRKLMER